MLMNKAFVFVVCGGKEHLETLHFSLNYLRKRTKQEIIVLTDSSRNEIPILHDSVIDVRCPEHYDHHQASIYLKTGIHLFLPKGKRYCYLDTDVIAIGNRTDEIFEKYQEPITFAQDHCEMNEFSASAVNCGCLEKWQDNWDRYNEAYEALNKNKQIPNYNLPKQKELRKVFHQLDNDVLSNLVFLLKYFLSPRKFRLNKDFYFDKKTRIWMHVTQGEVLHETPNVEIAERAGLIYNRFTKKWFDADRRPLWQPRCEHLNEYIQDKFHVKSTRPNWNHWNGGVFLFDDQSHEFLTKWHHWTISCFEDKRFRTRDQGTLIATVWSMQLQNHVTLSKKWNLLADYYSNKLVFHREYDSFSWNQNEERTRPEFLHIYHHWGDADWDVWQWVIEKGSDD